MNPDDSRTSAQRQAAATRAASGPSVMLLSRPHSPHLLTAEPDNRFAPNGRVRGLSGYDANHPPPAHPTDAKGAALQRLSVDALCELAEDYLRDSERWAGKARLAGARLVLERLAKFPGDTWEQRWLASGFDRAPRSWTDYFDVQAYCGHSVPLYGINVLLQLRVLRPSYSWLLDSRSRIMLGRFLDVNGGAALRDLRQLPAYRDAAAKLRADAEAGLARVLIRTGKRIDQLSGDDLLYYADVVKTSGRNRREHLIWELLVQSGPLADEAPTLRAAWSAKGNSRQHSTATLVDRYGIPASGVRDVLVGYLDELRPGMDYGSLEGLAYRLGRLFWWEILQINPTQADLRLSTEVATAWRERLAVTTDGRPRREVHSTLVALRGFYRDLVEWSHDDPARWGVWVAPCPVGRSEPRAASKVRLRQKSRMQDRTRMLTPLLPTLLAAAVEQKHRTATLLERAESCGDGEEFVIDDCRFIRDAPQARHNCARQQRVRVWARLADGQPRPIWIRSTGQRIDVTAMEEEGFWSWAVIETLRHTGIRKEELLEITQLSLRHYVAPTTGTLVPLLHIVPSKTDRERLIPMNPELVQVLLAVLRRAKAGSDQVPLSVRYDTSEKLHGQPFPHLFARRVGARQEVLSPFFLQQILAHIASVAGLTDAGQPVRVTPHDFRRLFATDAVNAGLPLHIAAALLGHLNLETTRGYTAVFPEHLIAAHQAFIERRRALRAEGESRAAEADEWAEFEQHFLLRRVALGECHRPYGTACVHEHACTRCRFLRVDPAQLGRIEEMTDNANERLAEAQDKGWLGEVAALEESLTHLRVRRDEARRRLDRGPNLFADTAQE